MDVGGSQARNKTITRACVQMCVCVCVVVAVINGSIKTSKILLRYVEHVCYIRDDFPETNERLLNWQENWDSDHKEDSESTSKLQRYHILDSNCSAIYPNISHHHCRHSGGITWIRT